MINFWLPAGLAALFLGFHATTGWVPLLDSANLAFHEAGHPLFGLLARSLAIPGGTLMQLLLPLACVFEFRREGRVLGMHVALLWFAENLLNVARYMADARVHQLPLVGGLNPEYAHDWTNMLRAVDLLTYEQTLADLVRLAAVTLMAWVLWRAWRHAAAVS